MRKLALIGALALALPCATRAELPFVTEEAETLAPGLFSLDVGVRYRDEPRDFAVPDREGQWDVGATRLRFSLGRSAELQLSGTALMVLEQDGSSETNFGDWVLGTKIRVLDPRRRRPSCSFLYEVKIPTASVENGGATDEADLFGHFVFSRPFGLTNAFHANLGVGLLGDPRSNSSQNDVFILRLAWQHELSDRWLVGLEGLGQTGPEEDDDPSRLRLVYALRVGTWTVHGGVSAGLGDDADRFALEVAFRRRFSLGGSDGTGSRPIPSASTSMPCPEVGVSPSRGPSGSRPRRPVPSRP